MYITKWKVVTYLNLEVVDNSFENVKNYAKISDEFCRRHKHKFWDNYTVCLDSIRYNNGAIKDVNALKLILRQLTRNEDDLVHTRGKRGLFNFIGGIRKFLFWVLG